MARVFLSIFLFSYSLLGWSQTGAFKYAINDSIEVIKNNQPLIEPWAGGMNNPQFNEIDVDFDCIKDLVVFDRSGNIIRVFINNGTTNQPSYRYAPEYANFFPSDLNHFLLLRDFNNDGKEDIFTEVPAGIKVYKNVSDSVLKFELYTDLLLADFNNGTTNVNTLHIDYPCIDDVDGDGDLDILSYYHIFKRVDYYENISTSNDTLRLDYGNSCWGNFFKSASTDSIILSSNCKGSIPSASQTKSSGHPGASLLTIDLDASGVKDLLMGVIGFSNLFKLHNVGSPQAAHIINTDYHYPGATNVAVDLPTFPVSFFLDVNNNGRKDLIVSTNDKDRGLDTSNVWFYDNFGANNQPNFQFNRKNLLVGDQIDVGTMAFPIIADISGDQIPDLIIGNLGYFVSYEDVNHELVRVSQIAYYKNIGTIINPVFEFVTDDLAGLSALNLDRITPTIADLDGDGDNDLLFGEETGSLRYYRNTAPMGSTANFVLVGDTFMHQNFGPNPSPFLFDINSDNKLDLLVGQRSGVVKLFLNQGTTTNPIFSNVEVDTLGGVVNYHGYDSNVMPYVGDLNGDSNFVLVMADSKGNLLYYDGIGSNFMGTYTITDSLKVSNSMVSVTGGNLNANDSLELIIGERTGGLLFYNLDAAAYAYSPYPRDTCGQNDPDAIWEINNQNPSFDIYPNPNNGSFRVEINTTEQGAGVISIIDLSGKTIGMQNFNSVQNSKFDFNNQDIKPGIYIVQIQISETVYRSKLVIQ